MQYIDENGSINLVGCKIKISDNCGAIDDVCGVYGTITNQNSVENRYFVTFNLPVGNLKGLWLRLEHLEDYAQ